MMVDLNSSHVDDKTKRNHNLSTNPQSSKNVCPICVEQKKKTKKILVLIQCPYCEYASCISHRFHECTRPKSPVPLEKIVSDKISNRVL